MTKKQNTPPSDTADASTAPHKRLMSLEEHESSHEANLKTASGKVSFKHAQKNNPKKVVIKQRNKKAFANLPPVSRTIPPDSKPAPLSELSLNEVRVDTQASKVLKEIGNNPTEREEMESLATSVDFDDLKGKRAKKGTNVKPLQLQFEQALIDAIKLGSKENDVSQSLFVGEILRHHPIINKYLKK